MNEELTEAESKRMTRTGKGAIVVATLAAVGIAFPGTLAILAVSDRPTVMTASDADVVWIDGPSPRQLETSPPRLLIAATDLRQREPIPATND